MSGILPRSDSHIDQPGSSEKNKKKQKNIRHNNKPKKIDYQWLEENMVEGVPPSSDKQHTVRLHVNTSFPTIFPLFPPLL